MASLIQKVTSGETLDFNDGLKLYDLPLCELGSLAHEIKQKKFTNQISYIRNYYLNILRGNILYF